MWEIDLADQIRSFLYSLLLGGVFALAFYIGESFRRASRIRGVWLWLCDILYFAVAGFVTFCFLLSRSNGEVRGYILFGIALGFLAFKVLFSKLILFCLIRFLILVTNLFCKIRSNILKLFHKILGKSQKSFEKLKNNAKKGLKKRE